MRKFFLIAVLLVGALNAFAQSRNYNGLPSLVWPKLYDVKFVKASDAQGEYDKPIFGESAKSLNGKSITLPGYIVPFETGVTKSKHFMFTSLPLNACFFCGVGGPETVVEVFLKNEISYSDKPMEIKGTLRINDKDPDKMIYVLENVELLGEAEF
ncbi:MAG TPA: DUF3299 domain-containing protein [Chryseosolibacter sp.]